MEPHHLEYMFYPPQCTPQAKRKKPNPFRVRLLLFCFYHYISVPPSAQCRCSLAPPQNCWPSCAFFRTLFAAGRYFMLSPWPFSRTGNLLLFCFKPAAALTGLWSFLIQPFLSPAFLPCCKIGHTKARQKRWIFQRKIRLIFLFLFY